MAEVPISSRQSRERADIVRPVRLQGFSDAVFATAATLLVVPLRKFELEESETLKDALVRRWPQLLVFVFGFLIICAIWESHAVRFRVVSKVDDVVVFCTLVSLMVTTFLPFSVALEGHFPRQEVSIVLSCTLLICLEIIELVIFMYAFKNPKLLSERFRQLEAGEKKEKKRQIIIKIVFNCVVFSLAMAFSNASFILGQILLCTVIIMPLFRRFLRRLTEKCLRRAESFYHVLSGRVSKERIELFSDAATAIIATLLILDLTTEEFPKKSEVDKLGLNKVLQNMWQNFVSYIGTYITVAVLWFVHHSVLQHIKIFTPLMVLFNNIFLAFLAGTPFISTLVNKYTGSSSHNAQVAIRVSSVIICICSSMPIAILGFSFWQRDLTLHSWAVPNAEESHTVRAHRYLFVKTLIIPIVSLITFFATLGSPHTTDVIYHASLIIVPVLFLLLKIAFACHCRQSIQANNSTENSPNTSRHSSISEESNSDLPMQSTANNMTAPQV